MDIKIIIFMGIAVCADACTWGNYDDCPSWPACSSSCGGGTRCRTCESCFWKIDKSFCEGCNQHCSYGHPFSNGQCQCPSWRTGACCDVCRHISIPRCLSGKQECGGSPDGIRCTQCEDPYYAGGYNQGCLACPGIITQCKAMSCTNAYNSVCKECYENNAIFKRWNADRECQRMCAWNNHYCWPGTCGNGLTKDCQCASGFYKTSTIDYSSTNAGETTCQPNSFPDILTCDAVAVGPNGEKKIAMGTNVSAVYGNYQPVRMEFTMVSEYNVNIVLNRPNYISEEKFGISDTTINVKVQTMAGSYVDKSTHKQFIDTTSGMHVTQRRQDSGYITVNDSKYNLQNGQSLCLEFEAKGGGYLKSKDTRWTTPIISGPVPYAKVAKQRTACYRYDNAPPEHCSKMGSCLAEPLTVLNRITRSGVSTVQFSGWSDPIPSGGLDYSASSIESYQITVNEVPPSNGSLIVDYARNTYSIKVKAAVNTIQLNLTSNSPKLYCITLEVKDGADNVRETRRFLLYDGTSSIETRKEKSFRFDSASSQTNFTWQTHANIVCLSWKDYFINRFYLQNKLLNPIENNPHGRITGVYEQTTSPMPVTGTPNVHGIIKYYVSWKLNNNYFTPEQLVPNFLNQSFCIKLNDSDGQTYTFNVRPVDIVNNTYSESRTVNIDRSNPHIFNVWFKRDGYSMLFVNSITDLTKMELLFEAFDPHSGLKSIEWIFALSNPPTELTRAQLDVGQIGNSNCPPDSADCYCPDIGRCEFFNYSVPINKLVIDDTYTGINYGNFSFTITVINNAMLSRTQHIHVLVDDSPPVPGTILNDSISSSVVTVQWAGFTDIESGIRLYRVYYAEYCLSNLSLDTDFELEVNESTSSVEVSRNFSGTRFVTVVAFNGALKPSTPLCSQEIDGLMQLPSTACAEIYQCKNKSCKNAYSPRCTECYEDNVMFKRWNGDRECQRMCAWNNHFCWPGNCNNGLTKDCHCVDGFVKTYTDDYSNIDSGETSCQPVTEPDIRICDIVVFGAKKLDSTATYSNPCTLLTDVYGNYQPLTLEFKMLSEFIVDRSTFFAFRPIFIKEEKFGITDTTINLKIQTLSGAYIKKLSQKLLMDKSSSNNVTRSHYDTGKLIVKAHSLQNGQALCMEFEAKGGGYLKSVDISSISEPIPYTKVTKQNTVCYRYDVIPPEHCSYFGHCLLEPLLLQTRITRSGTVTVEFSGWTDPIPAGGLSNTASSIERYELTVNEVVDANENLQVDEVILQKYDINANVTNMILQLASETPKLYCVSLNVQDVAGNSRKARRFVLFDNTSVIKTAQEERLYFSTAYPLTGGQWHNSSYVCLNWTGYFFNNIYINSKFLKHISPDFVFNITGVYEQSTGVLPVNGTPNVHGIISYFLSRSIDGTSFTPYDLVPDFPQQVFCETVANLTDGQAMTWRLRAVDIVGNRLDTNKTLRFDASPPYVGNMTLLHKQYDVKYIQQIRDLSGLTLNISAKDENSGVYAISVAVSVMGSVQSLTTLIITEVECSSMVDCYCISSDQCQKSDHIVKLVFDTQIDRNDYIFAKNCQLQVIVKNQAGSATIQIYTLEFDTTEPESGTINIEPIAPNNSSDNATHVAVKWVGFQDRESGILFYRIYLTEGCLNRSAALLGSEKDVYAEVSASTSLIQMPRNIVETGSVTLVAFNGALTASSPVCSMRTDDSTPVPLMSGESVHTRTIGITVGVVLSLIFVSAAAFVLVRKFRSKKRESSHLYVSFKATDKNHEGIYNVLYGLNLGEEHTQETSSTCLPKEDFYELASNQDN